MITIFLISVVVNKTVIIDEDIMEHNRFPYSHWVMMGLGDPGGFRWDDVNYTYSFGTYEEKKIAIAERIQTRLDERGLIGTLRHLFYAKQSRTWCNSTLAGSDYIGRDPMYEDSFFEKLLAENGQYFWIFRIFSNLYHFMMIVGIFINGYNNMKKTIIDDDLFFLRLSILGIILFMTLWECNSRYLYCFLPALLPLAIDGISKIRDTIVHARKTFCG